MSDIGFDLDTSIEETYLSCVTFTEPLIPEQPNNPAGEIRLIQYTFPYVPVGTYQIDENYAPAEPFLPTQVSNGLGNIAGIGNGLYVLTKFNKSGKYICMTSDTLTQAKSFNESLGHFKPYSISTPTAFYFTKRNGSPMTGEDNTLFGQLFSAFMKEYYDIDKQIDFELVGKDGFYAAVLTDSYSYNLMEFLYLQSKKEYDGEAEYWLNQFRLQAVPATAISHELNDNDFILVFEDFVKKYDFDVSYDDIDFSPLEEIDYKHNYVFNPNVYDVTSSWVRQILLSVLQRRNGMNVDFQNLMMLGAAGTGKTRLAEILPEILRDRGVNVKVFNAGNITTIMPSAEDDIMYTNAFKDGETTIVKTKLAKFLEELRDDVHTDVGIVLIDEFNRVGSTAQNKFLYFANDPKPEVYNIYGDKEYAIAKNVIYIVTGNVGSDFSSVYELDLAFQRRFTPIYFGKDVDDGAYSFVYDIVAESIIETMKILGLDEKAAKSLCNTNKQIITDLYTSIAQIVSDPTGEITPIAFGIGLYRGFVKTVLSNLTTEILMGINNPQINKHGVVTLIVNAIAAAQGISTNDVYLAYPEVQKLAGV